MRGSKTVYILPNLFTTASLFCGFYAILAAIDGSGRCTVAAVLIVVAMIFLPVMKVGGMQWRRTAPTPGNVLIASEAVPAAD